MISHVPPPIIPSVKTRKNVLGFPWDRALLDSPLIALEHLLSHRIYLSKTSSNCCRVVHSVFICTGTSNTPISPTSKQSITVHFADGTTLVLGRLISARNTTRWTSNPAATRIQLRTLPTFEPV